MKRKHLVFLPFMSMVCFILWILITQFDISDESFKRDHYKWKLERMEEFKCTCNLFNKKQFKGKVVSYNNPLGAGIRDEIVIKFDLSSDSVFFLDQEIKSFLGSTSYSILNGKLILHIGAGQGPQNLSKGDIVEKTTDSPNFIFKGNYGEKKLNPYYKFDDEFKSCKDVDTMDVFYNLTQFLKYDSLSRVSHPMDYRTIQYMNKRIEEQNVR